MQEDDDKITMFKGGVFLCREAPGLVQYSGAVTTLGKKG